MIDFFNRRALKEKEEEIETLKMRLKGDRVCSGYCKGCKYHFVDLDYNAFGLQTVHYCELDCKCKDFERKE